MSCATDDDEDDILDVRTAQQHEHSPVHVVLLTGDDDRHADDAPTQTSDVSRPSTFDMFVVNVLSTDSNVVSRISHSRSDEPTVMPAEQKSSWSE